MLMGGFAEQPVPGLAPGGCLPPARPGQPGSGCAANESAAGAMYAAVLGALRRRAPVVGYAHCQYINRAVKGWTAPAMHLKQGLLRFDGTPHAEYVAAVTRANKAATHRTASD